MAMTARQLRDRAHEMEVLAGFMCSVECRTQMLRLSNEYLEMAAWREARERENVVGSEVAGEGRRTTQS
jgi:hypothetical protein